MKRRYPQQINTRTKKARPTYIRKAQPRPIVFSRSNRQSGAIGKYSSSAFRRGEEVKTLDLNFTGAYNAAYTADTQPQQLLNLNTATASVQSLNLIQQGAGISQRIGNKVSLKSLRLRLQLKTTGNASAFITGGRILILYDRNPNGSYVAANNILSNSLQANTIGTGTYIDNINPNYFDRYVVLMDKLLTLPPDTSATTPDTTGPTQLDPVFQIDEFIKLRNLECQYNGSASPMTIAYQNIGSLQILTYGNVAGGADNWCLTGTARLRFRDN